MQSFDYLFGIPPLPFRVFEASICPLPLTQPQGIPGSFFSIDPASSASSLVLRDIHHGLLKVAEGWAPKFVRPAPEMASGSHPDVRANQWQERLWICLLSPNNAHVVSDEAKVRIEHIALNCFEIQNAQTFPNSSLTFPPLNCSGGSSAAADSGLCPNWDPWAHGHARMFNGHCAVNRDLPIPCRYQDRGHGQLRNRSLARLRWILHSCFSISQP